MHLAVRPPPAHLSHNIFHVALSSSIHPGAFWMRVLMQHHKSANFNFHRYLERKRNARPYLDQLRVIRGRREIIDAFLRAWNDRVAKWTSEEAAR
jgi:hypothetical protein